MKFFIFVVFLSHCFVYGQTVVPVCERTSQIRDAIVEKLQPIDSNMNCTLADEFLDQIQFLYLKNNGIKSLKVGDFSGLSSLKELGLSDTSLRSLPVGIFSGLHSLVNLFLSNNPKLSVLPVGAFSGLDYLITLALHNTNLSVLPVGVFSGPDRIDTLLLTGSSFSQPERDRLKKELPWTEIGYCTRRHRSCEWESGTF